MLKLFQTNQPHLQSSINIALRAIIALLLCVIAYHTSYLKAILREITRSNTEKQIVVNVNNTTPVGAAASPMSPQAVTPVTPAASKAQPAVAKPAPDKKAAASASSKQPSKPEPNPNPTTHKVEMLNNSPEGAMVFSPPYIHIKTGDSIEFTPASYGHNVQTPEDILGNNDAIPKNAKPFKGAMNESLIVKFTEPGIYLYICNYHYIVGHVGVIQVGNDSHNIDTVRKAGEALKGKIFSHPDRVDKYLKMVKTY